MPDLALDDVMLMVGLESLESLHTLHRCRQVCRTWNHKIMTNIWGNKAKKNIIKAEIKQWGQNLTREEAQAIERARESL